MTTNPMLMKAMMNSGNESNNTGILLMILLLVFVGSYFVLAYFADLPPFSSSETPGSTPPPPGMPPPSSGTTPPLGSDTRPERPTGFSAQYETVSGNDGQILLSIEIPSSSRNISDLWVSARLFWKRKAGGNWSALRSYSSEVSIVNSKWYIGTWDFPFRLFDTNDYEVRARLWNGRPEFDSNVNDFKYSDTPHSEQVTETVTGFFVTQESSAPPPPPPTGGGGLRGGH